MYPQPDSILSCPHCQALYRRSRDFDENGLDRWSDGKLCLDFTVDDYLDPAIRCASCKQLFITGTAQTRNQWGFNIPKDIKFHPANPLTLEDCFEVLKDENMLTTIGIFQAFNWFVDTNLDSKDKKSTRLAGEISMRLSIWNKLNDFIRYENRKFNQKEIQLFKENARALVRLIPKQIVDRELLMYKAELHRNLGQFFKSLAILFRIDATSSKTARKKMIKLNLLLNRRLMKLNRVPFRRTKLGRSLERLKWRIEDFMDKVSFRKK